MKLNYTVFQEILEYVEELSNGRCSFTFTEHDLSKITNTADIDTITYHLSLLIREDFIIGEHCSGGYFIVKDLSLAGHQILDAMRNNCLYTKIKHNLKTLGIEGLKQIPALAINILMSKT